VGALFNKPDALAKIAMNPTTSAFLQQPDFVAKLNVRKGEKADCFDPCSPALAPGCGLPDLSFWVLHRCCHVPHYHLCPQEVQSNPAAFNKYMSDPRMMQVLGVLLGVDIRTPESFGDAMDTAASGPKAPAPPSKQPEPVPEVVMTGASAAVRRHTRGSLRRRRECHARSSLTRHDRPCHLPLIASADEEKSEREAKAAAQREKELGNECYKARRTALFARFTERE